MFLVSTTNCFIFRQIHKCSVFFNTIMNCTIGSSWTFARKKSHHPPPEAPGYERADLPPHPWSLEEWCRLRVWSVHGFLLGQILPKKLSPGSGAKLSPAMASRGNATSDLLVFVCFQGGWGHCFCLEVLFWLEPHCQIKRCIKNKNQKLQQINPKMFLSSFCRSQSCHIQMRLKFSTTCHGDGANSGGKQFGNIFQQLGKQFGFAKIRNLKTSSFGSPLQISICQHRVLRVLSLETARGRSRLGTPIEAESAESFLHVEMRSTSLSSSSRNSKKCCSFVPFRWDIQWLFPLESKPLRKSNRSHESCRATWSNESWTDRPFKCDRQKLGRTKPKKTTVGLGNLWWAKWLWKWSWNTNIQDSFCWSCTVNFCWPPIQLIETSCWWARKGQGKYPGKKKLRPSSHPKKYCSFWSKKSGSTSRKLLQSQKKKTNNSSKTVTSESLKVWNLTRKKPMVSPNLSDLGTAAECRWDADAAPSDMFFSMFAHSDDV